jgi:hypothetical protein
MAGVIWGTAAFVVALFLVYPFAAESVGVVAALVGGSVATFTSRGRPWG